ncbi:alpha/beta fold hydrolase [Actinopolymorpha alba]|uniref:alpha/beta fold hydrolase n=1 Tax=Actinopolymorpha alba TaxID=533267 RepID=UPI0012F6B2DF|nr:alpha/beta fold hydrolase [Actinopolymorpha alba]
MSIALVVLFLVCVAAGGGVTLALAGVSARPWLFLSGGLLVLVAVAAGGVWLLARSLDPTRRRRFWTWGGGALAVGLALFAASVVVPVTDPRIPPATVAGVGYWQLPNGDRLAYTHREARGTRRDTPVIFLHGGPGVPDLAGDTEIFGRLAADGYDVYVYDQVGSGRSSRLADPSGYSVGRDVADLEVIRTRIGAPRVILIGHSYGATVAAGYLVAHPERVAKAVFSSPGALDPADRSDESMTSRLTPEEKRRLYAAVARPRLLLAYALTQVSPRAAYAFAGDAELDPRFDLTYNLSRSGVHCEGHPPAPALHGLGYYAIQVPQSPRTTPPPDLTKQLAGLATPGLVIKGSCDYLSWSSARAYLTLPDSRLVYLPRTGHNGYQEQPARFLAIVRAFLAGQDLPVAPYAGPHPPADFEGSP